VSSNLAEETKDGRRNAGLGGILGLLVVFALFEIFTIAAAMSLPPGRVSSNAANVLALLGQQAWPGFGGRLLTLAVMLSTVGTLKTSLIQVTRTLFAMARDRTLPSFLGRIHPRREAPCLAAIVAGAIALCLFAFSGFVGSVGDILARHHQRHRGLGVPGA
jgi:amino acid transporter